MYMRFVQLKIRADAVESFERFYEYRVTPAMLNEPGCIFVRLIQNDSNPTELISLTLWTSPEAASEYESSGHFDSLIEENEPFLEESSEWKIKLSEENTLEYTSVKERPTVQAMPIAAGTTEVDPSKQIANDMYVRIVSAKVIPGKFADLKRVYDERVAPELMKVHGCRGAYLIGSEGVDEGLSVTVWEDKETGDAYEASGKYAELLALETPYLSSLYQWKMSLDRNKQSDVRTSDDLSVKGYHIITGEQMGD